MTHNQAKFSRVAVKSALWVLKFLVPESPFQMLLQDGIDDLSDYIRENISGHMTISEMLTDELLYDLNIPYDQFELLRLCVENILKQITLDDRILERYGYDTTEIVDLLWEQYPSKNQYSEFEQLNIKKALTKIITEMITSIAGNDNFFPQFLGKIQHLMVDMEKQKKETDELRKHILELENILKESNLKPAFKISGKETKYQNDWNLPLFLNRKSPVVCLVDVYQLPHYFDKNDKKNEFSDLQHVISNILIDNKGNLNDHMLVVLGQPGSGKSTLITYILANYTMHCNKKILVYPFSFFKNVTWNANNSNLSEEILADIGISSIQQLDDCVLILDGFDEISITDNRENILNHLYEEWIRNTKQLNFSLIITCRENYLYRPEMLMCRYITLCLLDASQIRLFCDSYCLKIGTARYSDAFMQKLLAMRDIVGIPLILYMIVALKVDVSGSTTICDVYDNIFSLNNGIYDRCEYSATGHPITSPMKMQIHNSSKYIALKMWEENPEQAYVSREDYEMIINNECEDSRELQDVVLIGQYFQHVHYYEGIDTDQIRFVHRSIYEYFVALSIFDSVKIYLGLPNKKYKVEDLEKMLLSLLQKRQMSIDIEGYLSHKIHKKISTIKSESKMVCFNWWREFFNQLLIKGMSVCEDDVQRSNLKKINKELVGFVNVVSLLRIIARSCKEKSPYRLCGESTVIQQLCEEEPEIQMEAYIRYACEAYHNKRIKWIDRIDFSCLFLNGFQLNGVDLSNTDFSFSGLEKANLNGTNLRKANLLGANLHNADLRTSNLSSAKLCKADLRGAKLLSANISKANFDEALMNKKELAKGVYQEVSKWNVKWCDDMVL